MSEKDLGEQRFRDKPDMSMIWLRHLDRTNMAAGSYEGVYDPYVRQQLRLLPLSMQNWVLDQDDTYTEDVEKFEYRRRWGHKIGKKINPKMHNPEIPVRRFEDGSIDWDDPNIDSPKRVLEPEIDYEKFNLLVLMAAEKAGLSWQIDPLEVDAGDTIEYIEERKRTPFIPRPAEDEDGTE